MIRLRKAETGVEIHRAGWVVVDPQTVLRNGYLLTANGIIQEAGRGRIPKEGAVIDHGPGAVLPALVNAHTHLELSLFQGMLPLKKGFRTWVRKLIQYRDKTGPAKLVEGVQTGIEALKNSGCGIIGEISSMGLSLDLLVKSGLYGVWFREYLGGMLPAYMPTGSINENEPLTGDANTKKVTVSLAGHGPHTTAPELLVELKHRTRERGLPFGLHLSESEDELEFLTTGKGPWADFLKERDIDFGEWGLPTGSPVEYADRLGLLDRRTLAAHLIHARKREFEILKHRQVKVCLCPRSNAALHGRLPDLEGMLKAGLSPCLGTDSLACVDSLSMFDEMAYASLAYPGLSPETILTSATRNGAEAFGFSDRFGSLAPKRSALFNYVPTTAISSQDLLEQLVHGTFLQN